MTTTTRPAPTSAPAPRPTAAPLAYRPQLDGIRTVAVMLVLLFHAELPGFANGFLGLDLFFVLSGFLVTTVVLHGASASGELRLGAFFARRARRLLPAAVVTVLGTCALFVLLASKPERLELVSQARSALLYVANWQFILDGADYFARDVQESPFLHFWSLSVEEQFYVLLPLVLLVWWRWGRRNEVVLLGVLVGLVVASAVNQLVWAQVNPSWAYYATDARLYQLMTGAALAVLLRLRAARGADETTTARGAALLATAGAIGVAVVASELLAMAATTRNLVATPLLAALVVGVYLAPGAWLSRLLSLPTLTYLGRISYGIYLWHWPMLLAVGRVVEVGPALTAAVGTVLSVGLASMSYHLLEHPVRRARSLDGWWWPTVAGGLAVSLAAALLVAPALLQSDRTPIATASAATTRVDQSLTNRRLGRPVPPIDYAEVAENKGPEGVYCTPDAPEDCLVVDGPGQHVVLVGDSHAQMLTPAFEALAEEKGLRLSVSIVTGCPWQDGLLNTRNPTAVQEACTTAREDFYTETLPRMDADAVVLVHLPRSDRTWEGKIRSREGEQLPLARMQLDGVRRTVDLVEAAGASAVMVRSIIGTGGFDLGGFDPLDCLARARVLGDCVVTVPLERPLADGMYDTAAIDTESAGVVDLNPVICPDAPVCLPVVDGTVVWFNPTHVTATYLVEQREQIWTALTGTGLL
ncbi:acyltransferase [Nocardioides sp. OK12]|uniref:acyltransferase family protein n=1 Tax=Nocardioides sp. OK12 TaxID=2758661 RepID=UPI0021C4077C|nr:acyltransferase family protein [Nocardioides sp. OK12]GHJ57714.1 acyltransferase [Nocardioides sp. OK12]